MTNERLPQDGRHRHCCVQGGTPSASITATFRTDKYADTVRLLLAVAPDVFADDIFAMKGGTAINLFVRDMPRLSGDTKLIVENNAHQVKIEVKIVLRGSVLPVERRPLSARTSDLFDVWQLFESGDISDGMVECFVIYLTGHSRPTHEVPFGNDKDIAGEYSGPLSA